MRFSRKSLTDRTQKQTEHERTSIKKGTGEGWGLSTQVKHISQQSRKTQEAKHNQDTSFKINTIQNKIKYRSWKKNAPLPVLS